MMRSRMGSSGKVQHVLRCGEERDFSLFKATLLPAGAVFGSARILIEVSGERIFYTGDIKLCQGLSIGLAETVPADTLIMETNYGIPPPAAKTMERIIKFCSETLAEGAVPVFLGYSLGKAQQILSALAVAGLPTMLHGSV